MQDLNPVQFAWVELNVAEDEKESNEKIRNILEYLQPWLQPQMYSKMKERQTLEEADQVQEVNDDEFLKSLEHDGIKIEKLEKEIKNG